MTPGERLARARKRNGFKQRKHFCEYLASTGVNITYARLGSLERSESEPTLTEVNVLCGELEMTADWYLRGRTHSQLAMTNRLADLSLPQRKLVFMFIDALRF
jgi:transcriptional regulator with XRE-family HTH domain